MFKGRKDRGKHLAEKFKDLAGQRNVPVLTFPRPGSSPVPRSRIASEPLLRTHSSVNRRPRHFRPSLISDGSGAPEEEILSPRSWGEVKFL